MRTCFVTSFDRAVKFRENDPPTPCFDVAYPVCGKEEITICGRLRETAFEVMFPYDNDRLGLPFIILDAILKCPIDMRRDLAQNIVLVGGTAMSLGIKRRLQLELESLAKSDYYKENLFLNDFKFHSPPSKTNFTAWLGGSIYGGTDLVLTRSLTRELYSRNFRVPDWVNLLDDTRVSG